MWATSTLCSTTSPQAPSTTSFHTRSGRSPWTATPSSDSESLACQRPLVGTSRQASAARMGTTSLTTWRAHFRENWRWAVLAQPPNLLPLLTDRVASSRLVGLWNGFFAHDLPLNFRSGVRLGALQSEHTLESLF